MGKQPASYALSAHVFLLNSQPDQRPKKTERRSAVYSSSNS